MKAMTFNLKQIGLNFNATFSELKTNWRLILLFLLFLSGMISGSLFYSNHQETQKLIIETKCKEILGFTFGKLIIILLAIFIIPLVISLINSFSALGMPILITLPVVCGFTLVYVCSFLYSTYRIDGVIFTLLLIFPTAVINILLLLIGCNESLILSGIIAQNLFSVNKESRGELKAFFLRYGVIIIITSISAAICAISINLIGDKLIF